MTFGNENPGLLYLAIIQCPKTDVWYAKSRMGSHEVGSIMKTLAQGLNLEGKWISNHSTTKSVVAKLKKAGQQDHSNHLPCQRKLTR